MAEKKMTLKQARIELARSGGKSTKEKYGKSHFQKMAAASWEGRRKNKK